MNAETRHETEIEMWQRELRAAGWKPFKRRGRETLTIWVSPSGSLYRGPYGAWQMMKSIQQWGEKA